MGSIFVFSSLNIWDSPVWIHQQWYWIPSKGFGLFQSHQLGNAQWTDKRQVYAQLGRLSSAWSPDRTVCVQVVPQPAPLYLSLQVQRRCRRQLQLRPRKFRILLRLLLVSWHTLVMIIHPFSLWSCMVLKCRPGVLSSSCFYKHLL